MSPTTDDLRALLDERAAGAAAAAPSTATSRLASVHARVRRTRQVRTAVAAGALAVLVAGAATAAFGGFLPSQDRGLPADPVTRMPSTYLGRTLLTSTSVEASGAAGAKDWTVGVTPSLRQALVARCQGAAAEGTATVGLGARSYDLPCDGSSHTLAAGVVLRQTADGGDETVSAVALGPGPVRLSADAPAAGDRPAVVTLGIYEGDVTPFAESTAPFFPDTDVQIAVVDLDATVQQGTQGSDARGRGHLWVTVECQDDAGADLSRYGISWTLPGAAGPTVLSCLPNGQIGRLEDLGMTFSASKPVGEVAYQVVAKAPGGGQWEQAPRRGPAFRARLTLWITKGTGPAPTS